MKVFNIFSIPPDQIQFWQGTHIYCVRKLLIFLLVANKTEFCIFPAFYYFGHRYPPSVERIMFYAKETAYGDDLVFGIIRFKR